MSTDLVEFPCPFCEAACGAVEDGTVFHAMPPCDGFVRADALDFVTLARETMQRRIAAEDKL